MNYIVAKGEGHDVMQALQALEGLVNAKVSEGYTPIGNLVVTSFEKEGERVVSHKVTKILMLQPMFKEKDNRESIPLPKV